MLATCNHYINFSMRKLLFCTVSCLSAGLSAGCCERNCKTSSDCHCDRVCRKYGDCCPDVPQPEGCIEGKLTVTKTVWHATTDNCTSQCNSILCCVLISYIYNYIPLQTHHVKSPILFSLLVLPETALHNLFPFP